MRTELASSSLDNFKDTHGLKKELPQESWWETNGASGNVHPEFLAPDPDQPRKTMGKEELEALQGSIASRGVLESIRVTPRHRAPWARTHPDDDHRFFLIVSGHRRTRAAILAGLQTVPINIAIYQSEEEHRLDASILNDNRAELSPLERGHDFLKLKELGWQIEDLAKKTGRSRPYIDQRINLTRLDPSLQEIMGADTARNKKKRELTVPVGSALGQLREPTLRELHEMHELLFSGHHTELGKDFVPLESQTGDERRFMLQRMFYAIVSARGLPATAAVAFIQDRKVKLSNTKTYDLGASPQRHRPSRRQPLMDNLLQVITVSTIVDWSDDDYRRVYEYMIREDMESVVRASKRAKEIIARVHEQLHKIWENKQKTRPEVLDFMRSQKK